MLNIDVSFPLMGFKDTDTRVYAFKKKEFGFVSKGQGSFYNGLTLIDTNGSVYRVARVSLKGAAPFLISLRSFQSLEELNIEVEPIGNMTLQELKEKILLQIKRNPRHFSSLYDGEPWSKRLNAFNSFQELIDLFH